MLHVVAGGLDGREQQSVLTLLCLLVEVVDQERQDVWRDLDVTDASFRLGFLWKVVGAASRGARPFPL